MQITTGASTAHHPLQINQIKYHVLNIINCIHITTLTQSFRPLCSYSPLPTNASLFETVPACLLTLTPSTNSLQSIACRIYVRSRVHVLPHLDTTASIHRLQVDTLQLQHNSTDTQFIRINRMISRAECG